MAGGKLRLFSCRSGKCFVSKVCKYLNKRLEKEGVESVIVEDNDCEWMDFREFANGEYHYKIKDSDKHSVRGDKAYVIQLTERDPILKTSVHDNIFELIVLLDMLKRSGISKINLVSPMLSYSRQDVQSGREPIMTKAIAKIFERGKYIDSLITVDVHSRGAIDNAYDIKKELLFASKLIIPVLIDELNGDSSNLVFASTDEGGAKKVKYYAGQLGVKAVVSIKERDKPNSVERVSIKGDVEGKDVCFVDDMIDTGGTLVKAIEEASQKSIKNIYAICTHPLFNKSAKEELQRLYNEGILKRIIGTDTINHSKEFLEKNKWFKQVSVAELFAEVIFCLFMKKPVSNVYKPAESF